MLVFLAEFATVTMATWHRALLGIIGSIGIWCLVHAANSKSVVFENKSGEPAELWTDTPSEVIFKGLLQDSETVTVTVEVGETYYFTPIDSGGSKEHKKYTKKIKSNTKHVTLYDNKRMKKERKKNDVGCDDKGSCTVILENKYGKTLHVFWDGQQAVGQGSVRHNADMTLFTHLGHKFFVTEGEKADSKKVFTLTVKPDTTLVRLSKESKKEL